MNYCRSVTKLSENASSKGQNKKFLPEERGTPSPGPLPPEPWPCHIPSKLLMLLILTEMQLKRFKKQKSPTQGKGTPLSSDHNPLQPWPFAYAKYPIDVPYFNLLYRALYSFNYYKKKLKSGRKMRLARFLNQKFSYPVKGIFLPLDTHHSHSPLRLGMYQEYY